MKPRLFLIFVMIFSILAFLSGNIQQTAEQLYQSGIYKEEVEGDLEKAIVIYEQILKDFLENKTIAAKALYHIGLCYEKLGNQEAQKAYQRLIDEYPGQIQEVNHPVFLRLSSSPAGAFIFMCSCLSQGFCYSA